MKTLVHVLSAAAVMGLAFWAYNENYKTRGALAEVRRLHGEVVALLETRAVLRAEWAYLNRPDRLRELADLNFDRLALLPLGPEQMRDIAQVAYPPPPGAGRAPAEDAAGEGAAEESR